MSARRAVSSVCAALLAAALSAFAVAAPASAGPATAAAQPAPGPDGLFHIASPTAPNRHALEGHANLDADNAEKLVPGPGEARVGDQVVTVTEIQAPATCSSQRPLTAGLYSPEGHFMHRVEPNGDGAYALVIPRIPARYVLKLSIADPTCSGLGYRLRLSPVAGAAGDYSCQSAKRAETHAKRQLSIQQAKERKTPKARKARMRTLTAQARKDLGAATRERKASCR